MYLITGPSSNMIGLYYLPICAIAHETGLSTQEVTQGLRVLSDSGFAYYDDAHEVVWIPRMARHQIGETLRPGDKRIIGVIREALEYRHSRFYSAFVELYSECFHLPKMPQYQEPLESPFEAPSKPLRSQEQEQEQETTLCPVVPTGPISNGTQAIAKGILDHLNRAAGRHFRPVAGTLKPIASRLAAGATADQCRAVIDRQVRKWRSDPKMSEYLRPETLFAAAHFESYLGQIPLSRDEDGDDD